MNSLITGGTGFLGRHVARALMHAGHAVTLLGRNFSGVADLIEQGATPLAVDLRDMPAVVRACAGMQAVCHSGALSAPWGRRADFFDINVGGTQAVLAGCRQHHVHRLIHISSPSVIFDGRDHVDATESAPYPPRFTSVYALTKKLAEDAVRAAPEVPAVIVRPKAIFGPGDQTLLPRLIAAARRGRLPQIGDGHNRVDLTYVENVAHAVALALDAPQAVGKTYTITNDEHVLLWEVIRQVLNRLHIPAPKRVVALSVALSSAWLMERWAALTKREPRLTRYAAPASPPPIFTPSSSPTFTPTTLPDCTIFHRRGSSLAARAMTMSPCNAVWAHCGAVVSPHFCPMILLPAPSGSIRLPGHPCPASAPHTICTVMALSCSCPCRAMRADKWVCWPAPSMAACSWPPMAPGSHAPFGSAARHRPLPISSPMTPPPCCLRSNGCTPLGKRSRMSASDHAPIAEAFQRPIEQIYQCTEGLIAITCSHGSLHVQEDVVGVQWQPK
jgi:nucleoside-diphosphate-sugar epimerase